MSAALLSALLTLCCAVAASKLLQLSIRGNNLEGSARVLENCRNLVQLVRRHRGPAAEQGARQRDNAYFLPVLQ
jgi:hypothetical protein